MQIVKSFPVERCCFAFAGTFGHECGEPAVLVGIKHDTEGRWIGPFHAGRCAKCATIKGGENAEYRGKFEALDAERHVNRLSVWVPDPA